FYLTTFQSSASVTTTGGSLNYGVQARALSGSFAGTVNLSASGLPSGATATFSPTSIGTTTGSQLTVNVAAATAAGTYPFTVTGVSGTLSRDLPLKLIVTATSALPLG